MMQQKKLKIVIKAISNHKPMTNSSSELARYGPPRTPQPFIEPSIGYLVKKQPSALKKVKRDVAFERDITEESHAFMLMRVGDTNILRKFKKLKYLQGWKSKKAMYNLCEENLISKLQQSLLNVKQDRFRIKHRKFSSATDY